MRAGKRLARRTCAPHFLCPNLEPASQLTCVCAAFAREGDDMSRRVGRRLRLSARPHSRHSLTLYPLLSLLLPISLPPSLYCSVIRTPTEILLIKRLRCCDGEDRETVDNLKLDRPFVLVQGVRSFWGANEPATVGVGGV